MSSYPQHKQCLLCNHSELKPLERYRAAYLVQCTNCGFVFGDRIPTHQELIDHYNSTYTRDDYLSEITIKRYHEILDSFEPFRKSNRLIDVGSGIGYFLSVAKERGWDVYGTEYTDNAMEICRSKGFHMHQGKLDPKNYEPGFFDVITSFEVLEHINNPQEEIANFNAILRSGGLLYFTTPNFNALSRYWVKEKWTIIQWPEHLSYYTRKTMRGLLERNGFRQQKMLSTGFSLTRHQIATTHEKQRYIAANSSDEKLRRRMEYNPLLGLAKSIINGSFTLLGLGDSLKGFFVKK